MPFGGEGRVFPCERIRRRRALAETVRTSPLAVEAVMWRRLPHMIVADRARPPARSRGTGDDSFRRELPVHRWVPLLREVATNGGQAVCDRDFNAGAERAPLTACGAVVRCGSPLMVRSQRAPPPDLAPGPIAHAFRLKPDVLCRMPLSNEIRPPANPVLRSRRRRARPVPHGAPGSTLRAERLP
jgi:hypothetical protein